MSEEKYRIVNHIDFDTYHVGSPIQIDKGNILLDSTTGGLLMQLKLTNISQKTVKAVYLTADYYDVSDQLLQGGVNVNFLGLNCGAGESCGTNMPVKLASNDVYSVRLHIKKVVFEDESFVDVGDVTVTLPKQEKIKSEFVTAAKSLVNDNAEYVPLKLEHDVWLCSCGNVNEGDVCSKCYAEKDKVFRSILAAPLREETERLAKEREEQERLEQEERERREREERAEREKYEKEKAEHKKKLVKTGTIVLIGIIAVIAIIFLIVSYNNKQKIIAAYQDGDYNAVLELTEDMYGNHIPNDILPLHNDALASIREEMAHYQTKISGGYLNTLGIKSNGKVVAAGDNRFGQREVSDWTDIVSAFSGSFHTVGLKSDGTVIAIGNNEYGQCDVSDWSDIIAISTKWNHTVGLKSDGTVVAVGNNTYGQCDVSDWTDIVSISALGTMHTVGLKSDGTVVAVGDNTYGQCDVSDWTDIVAVSTGSWHTVGLKSDGTVVAVGHNAYGQCDVSDWLDIIAITADRICTMGLKANGSIMAVGYTIKIDNNGSYAADKDVKDLISNSDWNDIVAIAAYPMHIVGLKSDGTVVAAGDDFWDQCDVDDWDLW